MSVNVCENRFHCWHAWGRAVSKSKHGPFASNSVFRCCNCGKFEDVEGSAYDESEVKPYYHGGPAA